MEVRQHQTDDKVHQGIGKIHKTAVQVEIWTGVQLYTI